MNAAQDRDEAMVDIRDLALLLNKSEDWVRRHARDITGFKVGGVWRFYPSKVRAHFEQPRDPWVLPTRRKMRRAS